LLRRKQQKYFLTKGRNYEGTKGWKFFIGARMINTDDRQHRSILQRIARRAMMERELLPDFSVQAMPSLTEFKGLQYELKNQRRRSCTLTKRKEGYMVMTAAPTWRVFSASTLI
jgi:hypothetical protein